MVERFRDELGDWRLAVHSVLGARVNGPWALAVGRRLAERYGVDAQVMPSDDGIVVRLPDTADEPPGADVVVFEPDEITQLVEESVGTSALFAARSGSAPHGHCCCRAATRAAANRSGSNGNAPRNCSTSPASTRTSRSPWRPPGSASGRLRPAGAGRADA